MKFRFGFQNNSGIWFLIPTLVIDTEAFETHPNNTYSDYLDICITWLNWQVYFGFKFYL